MADDDRADAEQQDESSSKDRQGQEAAAALDKMTDNVPEKQLDENRVRAAMAALAEAQRADKEAARARERELAAVKVSADDVKVLAAEAEVDAKAAERRLRECGGDLEAALESYL